MTSKFEQTRGTFEQNSSKFRTKSEQNSSQKEAFLTEDRSFSSIPDTYWGLSWRATIFIFSELDCNNIILQWLQSDFLQNFLIYVTAAIFCHQRSFWHLRSTTERTPEKQAERCKRSSAQWRVLELQSCSGSRWRHIELVNQGSNMCRGRKVLLKGDMMCVNFR